MISIYFTNEKGSASPAFRGRCNMLVTHSGRRITVACCVVSGVEGIKLLPADTY